MTTGIVRCAAVAAAVAAMLVSGAGRVSADTASAAALKAAFLYNFVRFIEWPSDSLPPSRALTICIAGDQAVADALDEMVRGRSVLGHEVALLRPRVDDESVKACHVLYVSGLDQRRAVELIDRLAGAPVLTASDCDNFAELGGVAHFFVDNGKMRFAVALRQVSPCCRYSAGSGIMIPLFR